LLSHVKVQCESVTMLGMWMDTIL